jgi:hypothetical protein
MPGTGVLMEGAMQHAAQPGRQFMQAMLSLRPGRRGGGVGMR